MRQVTRNQSALESSYRKVFIKLLTAATSAPRAVDEYFFGTAEDYTDETPEQRAYFYGFIIFSVALTIFMHVIVK